MDKGRSDGDEDGTVLTCISGDRSILGAACVRRPAREAAAVTTIGRADRDPCDQAGGAAFMAETRPDGVITGAAKVSGILANDGYPADSLYDKLMIETKLIQAARQTGVAALLFLGPSSIDPREAPQPLLEDARPTGPPEPTDQWHAVANFAGIKPCQTYRRQYGCAFIAAIPCNLYRPNDNFHREHCHIIGGMIRRCHDPRRRGNIAVTGWCGGRTHKVLDLSGLTGLGWRAGIPVRERAARHVRRMPRPGKPRAHAHRPGRNRWP